MQPYAVGGSCGHLSHDKKFICKAGKVLDACVLLQVVKAHLRCELLEGIPGVVHGHDLLAPLLLRERPEVHDLPDTANICKHILQKDATNERAATQVPHGTEIIAQLHAGLLTGIGYRIAREKIERSRHDAVLHMTVHTRESTCVPWVLMIFIVSPFFMRTALPLPPGIRTRSVLGLASTAVAAAAEMHILPEIGSGELQAVILQVTLCRPTWLSSQPAENTNFAVKQISMRIKRSQSQQLGLGLLVMANMTFTCGALRADDLSLCKGPPHCERLRIELRSCNSTLAIGLPLILLTWRT